MGFYGDGGGGAPEADPNIGKSAVMSARTGKKYLSWMMDRSEITDAWAMEDRLRDKTVFQPMQDRFIRDAKTWDTPGRQAAAARTAAADVTSGIAQQRDQDERAMAAMGVDPSSGRGIASRRRAGIERGLAVAGAKNLARAGVRKEGMALRGEAINLGSGLAVNPLSSFTAGTSAGARGLEGAMQGYGQQGSILNQDYANKLAAWGREQQQGNPFMDALGMGAGFLMSSDEEVKTKKKPARGMLKAVRDMRVEDWEYEPDAPGGDGGGVPHTGTYAQDFQAATGKGDGKTIPVVDAIGVNLGAVKELDAAVDKLSKKVDALSGKRKARGVREKAA